MKSRMLGRIRIGMVEPATHRTHHFVHRYDRGRETKHVNVIYVKSILQDAVTIDTEYLDVIIFRVYHYALSKRQLC